MTSVKLVAEIGCNHQGSLALAHQMIEALAASGAAYYVKFQKRNSRELLSREEYASPHPDPKHSFGESYGAHREFLEFSLDEHRQLKEFSEKRGLRYACSVWDLTSAKEIASLAPDYIKIPSACNLNFPLLKFLCEKFRGPLHISLGMTSAEELNRIASFLEKAGALERTVFYACTSSYPTPPSESCLLEIEKIKERFGAITPAVGFSGHHTDTAIDIAACALGARWIERHFTMNRLWKGTDHAASLLPEDFMRLRNDLALVAPALRYKDGAILPIERLQRNKLKKIVPEALPGNL